MNVLIRCIEAAAKSTQVIEKDPGDYYANKDAALGVWSAALRAFDESSAATQACFPGTRDYMLRQIEIHSYVGD